MSAAGTDIDWMRASEDCALIEACRAAASVAAQFETIRPKMRRRSSFSELFQRLYSAARGARRA